MAKILVTGGSGFIGTNLIDALLNQNLPVLNLDVAPPKKESHRTCWLPVDIRDYESLHQTITEFSPTLVIHLAARTDLRSNRLKDYSANTDGVENLLTVLDTLPELRRVIFASSMYVCQPGYQPQHGDDYAPHTVYGESKVLTEKIIKEKNQRIPGPSFDRLPSGDRISGNPMTCFLKSYWEENSSTSDSEPVRKPTVTLITRFIRSCQFCRLHP
ncbi:NAD(P)-dependent oxidoreductase [Siphonobacter sp. BAB-5405]|uniref:NAD-dependent epimerase/dehydratase family protein n=1 Tax=Siphonobacter sp. BAB-5405 TaxID=1864825 RepID=UPI0018EAD908|nr:NAD-dependent epimerase/dehydratase family protein [Siphonobacter sp. BAB-5405]